MVVAPAPGAVVELSRRRLLQLGGSLALVGATGSLGLLARGPAGSTGSLLRSELPLPAPFTLPLRFPPELRPGPDGTLTLTQRAAEVEVLPGRRTPVRGYEGTFPGPTVHARRGEPVRLRVRNELDVATAVHLHGGHTPADSDGFPTDLVLPGDQRTHHYPMTQRAAPLWYHDHAMDRTGPNVQAGLAGSFLVHDDEDDALPLPRGDRDLTLMVCDRAFDADAAFRYPLAADGPGVGDAWLGGVLGDVLLVNGVPWPVHDVAAARHRLRLLNACSARRLELVLDPPPPSGPGLLQVGSDGGLLAAPQHRPTVTLAPGERVEVVVDFAAWPVGTEVTVRNRLGEGATAGVLRFVVARRGRDDSTVPRVLSEVPRVDPADAVRRRTFAFRLERPTGAAAGHGGHRSSGDGRLTWTVDGRVFDPGADVARPRLGELEVWRFSTDVHHPVHVHLDHVQVLSRNGRTPLAGDAGWKDTVDLLPGETCEVAVRFTDHRGRYVLHCHNLEHEDRAMMAAFSVV